MRGPAAAAADGDDLAVDEELAAPHAERLATLEGPGEAQLAHRAAGADRLRPRRLGRVLGEEQGCVGGARVGAARRLGDHGVDRMASIDGRR